MSGLTRSEHLALSLIGAGRTCLRDSAVDHRSALSLSNAGLIALTESGYVVTDNGREVLRIARAPNGSSGPQNTARWEYAQTLRDAGWSLEMIGDALGVTRERVRQKTTRVARSGKSEPVDPVKVVALVRRPDIDGIPALERASGIGAVSLQECLAALRLYPAVLRLFHWRRAAPGRRHLASIIRAEYERLGRTPTLRELARAMNVGPTAAGPRLAAAFGTIREAMQYAGVPHRARGGQTHCRRGHVLADPSSYWIVRQGGYESRKCKQCVRLSKASRVARLLSPTPDATP